MSDRILRTQELVRAFEETLAELPGLSEEERASAVRRYAESVAVLVEQTPEEDMQKQYLLPALIRELDALRRRWEAE